MDNSLLADACHIKTGKLDSNHAVKGGQYPFFTCSSLPDTIDSYAFDEDVVLVAGNNAQGNFHVNRYKGKFNAYQRTYILTTKPDYNIDFIFYSLKLELKRLKDKSQGSQTKFLTMPILNNIVLRKLNLNHQQKIASVLSALDSKIELNNSINAELEAMAKTLYDYWFVQFDFPDKNGKPYKTSGGKMVWNNELKREIPAGWESLKLSSKFTFEKGIEPGSAEYTDQKESIYHVNFIRVGDVDGSSAIFIDTRPKSYAMVFERDVLVTFDGSVGKVAFGLQGAYSGGLRKIYDKSGLIDNSLIYFIFMDERLIKTIHKYATGSILLHAGSSIDILKIPYNEKIYLEYQNIIKTSYNKMVINKKENQKLTKLRDWLLPMLMNGQVKVGKD
jgi:type I restriction enzyme S subunit